MFTSHSFHFLPKLNDKLYNTFLLLLCYGKYLTFKLMSITGWSCIMGTGIHYGKEYIGMSAIKQASPDSDIREEPCTPSGVCFRYAFKSQSLYFFRVVESEKISWCAPGRDFRKSHVCFHLNPVGESLTLQAARAQQTGTVSLRQCRKPPPHPLPI